MSSTRSALCRPFLPVAGASPGHGRISPSAYARNRERRACAVAGQHRSTQRKRPRGRDDEEALTAAIIRLASQYGRYGYRRITALLRTEGWHVNAKRVQRIWRREGLKVPQKQPKRGRLWLNDGSCIRLRPCWPNHVWSYDFVMDRTHDGRKFRMLTVIDEFTRRCMAVVVERRLNSDNVLHCLTELFVQHGPPDHIRSDNGSEFAAHAVRDWLGRIGVKTLYIEPGSSRARPCCCSVPSHLHNRFLILQVSSSTRGNPASLDAPAPRRKMTWPSGIAVSIGHFQAWWVHRSSCILPLLLIRSARH